MGITLFTHGKDVFYSAYKLHHPLMKQEILNFLSVINKHFDGSCYNRINANFIQDKITFHDIGSLFNYVEQIESFEIDIDLPFFVKTERDVQISKYLLEDALSLEYIKNLESSPSFIIRCYVFVFNDTQQYVYPGEGFFDFSASAKINRTNFNEFMKEFDSSIDGNHIDVDSELYGREHITRFGFKDNIPCPFVY